jgi:hypothetical protein
MVRSSCSSVEHDLDSDPDEGSGGNLNYDPWKLRELLEEIGPILDDVPERSSACWIPI